MTRLQTCLLAAALLLPADCFKVAPAPAGETPWAEAEGRQLSEVTLVPTSGSCDSGSMQDQYSHRRRNDCDEYGYYRRRNYACSYSCDNKPPPSPSSPPSPPAL